MSPGRHTGGYAGAGAEADPDAAGDRDSNGNRVPSAADTHRWAPFAQGSRSFVDGVFDRQVGGRRPGCRNGGLKEWLAGWIRPSTQRANADYRAVSPPRF